ncbi:unnamed protein product, partial [Staurois parvus]
MYTHTCTHIHTQIHTHRHMYIQTHIHTQTHAHTHPYKKLQYFLTFTHRDGYCTLGRGREHSTHSFLCFHCAQLLSSLMASNVSDRAGLSSGPAQQDGPGGILAPTIISTRQCEQASANFKACTTVL